MYEHLQKWGPRKQEVKFFLRHEDSPTESSDQGVCSFALCCKPKEGSLSWESPDSQLVRNNVHCRHHKFITVSVVVRQRVNDYENQKKSKSDSLVFFQNVGQPKSLCVSL